jgi:hypothetical protein
VFERGSPDLALRDCGRIDVPQLLLFVTHVSLFFEDTQLRSHGGIMGLARKLVHHVAGRRAPMTVEDPHDLTFAACQSRTDERLHLLRAHVVGGVWRVDSAVLEAVGVTPMGALKFR